MIKNKIKTPELLTANQLADYLQLNVGSVYRLSENGTIPSVKIGKKMLRFNLADVLKKY